MGPNSTFCHKLCPLLSSLAFVLPHRCLASLWGGRLEAHESIPSYPSLLPCIPSPMPFSITCPISFLVSLYLLLFPELCFPLTSCSSTSWVLLALGLVRLHHANKQLCPRRYQAHLPCCLLVSPMVGREVLSCLRMLMRGREGGSVGLLQGSDPFWLSPFPEVGRTDSIFFLQNGARVLT